MHSTTNFSYTYESMLARAKEEIARDIAEGRVPFLIDSFAELHVYVDANCYGGACDDAAPDPEILVSVVNRVQNAVDAWLKERAAGLKRPVTVEHCTSCGAPTHASESDDRGRCVSCMRASGVTPAVPCDHAEWAPACPFCNAPHVAVAVPPSDKPRKFLVAAFDVTDLNEAQIASLWSHVAAQAEASDQDYASDENMENYPDVTVEIAEVSL